MIWLRRSEHGSAKNAELSDYYNHKLAGGKWNHMMDQTTWVTLRGTTSRRSMSCPRFRKNSGACSSRDGHYRGRNGGAMARCV